MVSVAVCAVIIILVAVQPAFITHILLVISSPFHSARQTVSANSESFFAAFVSRKALVEENTSLREDLFRAQVKSDLYDSLRREYARVSVDTSSTTSSVLTARVLETPPFSPYDTLLIDAGTAQGVSSGDVVFFDATVALGVVDSVSKNTSRIRLFSSPGFEQEVRIGENDFLVLARGLGGGAFEVSVPKEADVSRNDNVFLVSGEILGSVKQITESDAEAFSVVRAVMPQNIFEIRTVVIRPDENLE